MIWFFVMINCFCFLGAVSNPEVASFGSIISGSIAIDPETNLSMRLSSTRIQAEELPKFSGPFGETLTIGKNNYPIIIEYSRQGSDTFTTTARSIVMSCNQQRLFLDITEHKTDQTHNQSDLITTQEIVLEAVEVEDHSASLVTYAKGAWGRFWNKQRVPFEVIETLYEVQIKDRAVVMFRRVPLLPLELRRKVDSAWYVPGQGEQWYVPKNRNERIEIFTKLFPKYNDQFRK